MKKNKILFSIIATTILFTGCDNDDMNDDNIEKEQIQPAPTKISGVVVDGYIKQATVCIDLNNNNKCEDNEPQTKTDELGNYNLDISSLSKTDIENSKILSLGGIDISTNKEFTGILKSVIINNTTEINLNPITTIVAEKVKSNKEYIDKLREVSKALGINKEEINSDLLKGDENLLKIALKIQTTLNTFSENKTEEEKSEILKKFSNSFNGTDKNINDIVNSIDNPLFNDLKDKVKEFNNNINNISGNIEDIQKIAEIKKEILNNILNNDNGEALDNSTTSESNIDFYNANAGLIDNSNIVALSSFIKNLEGEFILENGNIFNNTFKDLLLLDLTGITTLEEFNNLVQNSSTNSKAKSIIKNLFDTYTLDKNYITEE